jgi:hypothetical protein
MVKRVKATPKIPPIAPRPVAQSAVDWYKAKYPVDGAADIERWAAAGEIAIVDKKDGPPVPFTRDEVAGMGPRMASVMDEWVAAGIVVIVDKPSDQQVRQEPVCQQCKRTIPRDANYCPYCAHPVISAAPQQSRPASCEPMMVHRETLEVFRKSHPAFAEFLETTGRVRIIEKIDQ